MLYTQELRFLVASSEKVLAVKLLFSGDDLALRFLSHTTCPFGILHMGRVVIGVNNFPPLQDATLTLSPGVLI